MNQTHIPFSYLHVTSIYVQVIAVRTFTAVTKLWEIMQNFVINLQRYLLKLLIDNMLCVEFL